MMHLFKGTNRVQFYSINQFFGDFRRFKISACKVNIIRNISTQIKPFNYLVGYFLATPNQHGLPEDYLIRFVFVSNWGERCPCDIEIFRCGVFREGEPFRAR